MPRAENANYRCDCESTERTFSHKERMLNQLPPFKFRALVGAICAMVRKRLLLSDSNVKGCGKRLDFQTFFLDVQEQLARKQRPAACLWVAVHDKRR